MSLLPLDLNLKPLRPYQQESYDALRQSIRDNLTRPVLKLPTGAGKTFLTAHMVANCLRRDKRPLFVVPRISLIDGRSGTVKRFEEQGITDIGVIQRNHPRTNPQARVQIASIDTLIRRPHLMKGFDLVVQDECHLIRAEFYEWMNRELTAVFLGLSATPYSRGMGLHWTNLVQGPSYQLLESIGALCPIEAWEPEHNPDRTKVPTAHGEFVDAEATQAMSDKAIVADVYEMWVERGSKNKWFVFGQNCNHAKLLMKSFTDRGVRCGYIDANTPMSERDSEDEDSDALLCRYRRGDIDVMFSVECLGIGVDEDVRGISLAYMTKSRMKLEQNIGRGRRNAPGKSVCIINDHGRNLVDLGFPEDYEFNELDKRNPKDKGEAYPEMEPPKPKKCGGCGRLLPPRTSICPSCGAKPLVSNVDTIPGKLVKVEKKKAVNRVHQRIFSELYDIGRKAGYKLNWAALSFYEMTGVKADGLKMRGSSIRSDDVKAFVAQKRKEWRAKKKAEIESRMSA